MDKGESGALLGWGTCSGSLLRVDLCFRLRLLSCGGCAAGHGVRAAPNSSSGPAASAFQGKGFREFNLPVEFVATGELSWAVSSRSVLGSCLDPSLMARSPTAWEILWQSPRNVSLCWWQCGGGSGPPGGLLRCSESEGRSLREETGKSHSPQSPSTALLSA